MAIPLLPFLDPAPYQIPLVDVKTGMMSDAWQRYHINLERVIFGIWREQSYDAADFTTQAPGISWNVAGANLAQLTIFQMGPIAAVFFFVSGSTVSADIDILKIRIPTLRAASSPILDAFQNTIVINQNPAATELGEAYVVNVSAAVNAPVQINIEKASGTDFLAASPAIRVQGCAVFQCQSVVTP